MCQCPKCGLEVEDSLTWCPICDAGRDTAAEAEIPLAWVVAEHVSEPPQAIQAARAVKNATGERVRPEAGVPRRFGVGKLMLITAFFAVVFALLRCLNAHPLVFVGVAGFVTIIGLSQAILYSGKRPRRASVVTGTAIGALLPLVMFVFLVLTGESRFAIESAIIFVVATLVYAVIGAGLGYVAGCLIAAIFLGKGSTLRDTEKHPSEPPDPFRPEDPKSGSPDDPPGA